MQNRLALSMCRRRAFLAAMASGFWHGRMLGAGLGMPRYAQAVLAKKPAGYWRLGELSGTKAENIGTTKLAGIYMGNPGLGQPGALKGDRDGAMMLDGAGAHMQVPVAAEFSQPASGHGLAVEIWMRPDSLSFKGEGPDAYVHWLGKGERGQVEWGFRFYSRESSRPNRLSAYIWNADGGLGSGAYFEDKLTPGEWMHIVATFDPGDGHSPKAGVSIYKNGALRGGPGNQPGALYKAYAITPAQGPAPVRVGTRDGKSFLTGALDELAIYPRVLKPFEIQQNYRAGI